jgi:hypothetical protein
MQIDFQNNISVPIHYQHSPLMPVYESIYKHLQHVDIPFYSWDNPYDRSDKMAQLVKCAQVLGITVDPQQAGQDYFNQLHAQYEHGYDGRVEWLQFHELVHICEATGHNLFRQRALHIDYRHLSGRLERPFDTEWISVGVTQVCRGDVFVMEAELGKMPYSYWADGENNSMARLCELAKPWLVLKPQLLVAVEDIDFMSNVDREGFANWWHPRQSAWCQHWGLNTWSIENMFSGLIVGRIDPESMEILTDQLLQGHVPSRVRP